MAVGVIASDLMDAVAVVLELATAGAGVSVTLDDGGVPPGPVPVLISGPAGVAAAVARLVDAGCTQIMAIHDAACAGPVGAMADALVGALGTGFAVACPARPNRGYTLYQGHVFRRQSLLHGAAPGDQSSYVRLLALQSDGTAGLVPHATVRSGSDAIRIAVAAQRDQGRQIAILDATDAEDLRAIATAIGTQAAVIGNPELAALMAAATMTGTNGPPAAQPSITGPACILAAATGRTALYQAGHARNHLPHTTLSANTLAWALPLLGNTPLLITPAPGAPEPAAALATLAQALVHHGVRRLLVTGAATAQAVTSALGVTRLSPGPTLPWLLAEGTGPPILLALTDGEWGGRDLFLEV